MDGKVICIQKTLKVREKNAEGEEEEAAHVSGPAEGNWVYSHSHRAHSHDVYSLALCYTPNANSTVKGRPEPYSVPSSTSTNTAGHWILLSGGLDTKLCTYSATNFVKVRPSWIPAVPANALVGHSDKYDVVTMRHRHHLDIWRVVLAEDAHSQQSDAAACQLSLRLQAKGDEHIHASAVSADGKYIAISSSRGVRMWRTVLQTNAAAPAVSSSSSSSKKSKKAKSSTAAAAPVVVASSNQSLELELVPLPAQLASPKEFCHALAFNHSSTQLAVYGSTSASVMVFDITENSAPATTPVSQKKTAQQRRKRAMDEDYEQEEEATDLTDEEERDEEALATVQLKLNVSFDHRRNVTTDVAREADGEGLALAVNSFRFSPDDRCLAVSSCAEEVYVYDLESKRLHWRLPRSSSSVTDIQFLASPAPSAVAASTTPSSSSSKKGQQSTQSTAAAGATLLVLTASNMFHLFDVANMRLSAWSAENSDLIPKYVRQMPGALCGAALDPADSNKLILYGQGYCVLVKLNEKIPQKPKLVTQTTTALMQKTLLKKRKAARFNRTNGDDDEEEGKKNTAAGAEDVSNFVVINIYRNLLHVGCVDSKQLVSFRIELRSCVL